jgi:hypothetical protein
VQERVEGENSTDSDYIVCGVMWHRFGLQDAGKELLRAADSTDPDMRALAWAMLAKSGTPLEDLFFRHSVHPRSNLK